TPWLPAKTQIRFRLRLGVTVRCNPARRIARFSSIPREPGGLVFRFISSVARAQISDARSDVPVRLETSVPTIGSSETSLRSAFSDSFLILFTLHFCDEAFSQPPNGAQ